MQSALLPGHPQAPLAATGPASTGPTVLDFPNPRMPEDPPIVAPGSPSRLPEPTGSRWTPHPEDSPALNRSLALLRAAGPWIPVLVVSLLAGVLPASAQTLVSHSEYTGFSSGLPEDTGSTWVRIGTGPVLLLDRGELLVNDNSGGEVVAYQGLLGRIEAAHDLVFRGEVQVLSNLGGNAALVEVSRPGLEVIVQLYRDHVAVLERVDASSTRWLGSAPVDLERFREISVRKTSSSSPGAEEVIVEVDRVELLRVQPRAEGTLGLGRVLFGSMGYADMGATLWRWVEVEAQLEQVGTPVESATLGGLKSRFVR